MVDGKRTWSGSGRDECKVRTLLREDDYQEWIWLQTKLKYDNEATKYFSSLKNVLKRRQ